MKMTCLYCGEVLVEKQGRYCIYLGCPKCNGQGITPKHEYHRRVEPSDFDFPMSWDNYRSLCHEHGWPDPGLNEVAPEEETVPQPQEIIYRTSNMGKQEFDLLQQTARQVKYLLNKLNEHIDFAKKKTEVKKPKQHKELGIDIG